MEIFSLTHANDIDGLGSAALLKVAYGMGSENIFFTDYSEEGLSYSIKKLSERIGKKSITLFMTDLGMNDYLIDTYRKIIMKVKRQGGKVVWFDHHVWSLSQIKKIASLCDVAIIGENSRYCATEITYRNLISGKMLSKNNKFLRKFVWIVHKSDFNKKPEKRKDYELIGTYAMSIMSYITLGPSEIRDKKLRDIIDVIAAGRFSSPRIVSDGRKFSDRNERLTKIMLKNLYKIGDIAFVGFSPNLQSTLGCGAIMDKTKCDIAIYINTENHTGHLRSRISDTTLLSRRMGGGGHPHASGFPIDRKRFSGFGSDASRKEFVEFLAGEIEKTYRG